MMRSIWLLMMICISSSLCSGDDDRPVVTTDSGSVRGLHLTSRAKRDFYAFTKIPYAKPPVGELRFKNPVAADKWDGVLDTDKQIPKCTQIPIFDPKLFNETIGEEDCLYLNVFTPKISEEAKMPVIIFIHGGGFRSQYPLSGPPSRAKYIMDEDVVLVDMHYRLGILGFLSLEDSVIPGNFGLKDQSLAIQWVSKNIKPFGGDPDKITIFGNSAGGASTHYHLISPMTKDLIQGGISQSGTATCLWALSPPGQSAKNARIVAQHLDCPTESSQEIIECLQQKSAEDITARERLFITRDFDPPVAFPPVIEKDVDNPFLPDSPFNLPVEKPWIIGLTSEDGAFKLPSYTFWPELMESFKANPSDILPESLGFANFSSNPHHISEEIIKEYAKDGFTDRNFIDLHTGGFFIFGIDKSLKLSGGPKYLYLFSYRGKTSVLDFASKIIEKDVSQFGVSHTEELLYLFNFEDELHDPNMMTEADHEVSKRLISTWVKFAKNQKLSEEEWPQYNEENKKYLKISKEDTIESKLWQDKFDFWSKLGVRDKMEQLNI